MKKLFLITATTASVLLVASCYAANFKTGTVTTAQAKVALSHKAHTKPGMVGIESTQLYVCNSTNLPAQTGTAITVAFPGTGVAAQTPPPGYCAYLVSDAPFSVPVNIYAPAGSVSPIFSSTLSSGQMWGVTYNAQTGVYPVVQTQ
jgi:hypothetical protein